MATDGKRLISHFTRPGTTTRLEPVSYSIFWSQQHRTGRAFASYRESPQSLHSPWSKEECLRGLRDLQQAGFLGTSQLSRLTKTIFLQQECHDFIARVTSPGQKTDFCERLSVSLNYARTRYEEPYRPVGEELFFLVFCQSSNKMFPTNGHIIAESAAFLTGVARPFISRSKLTRSIGQRAIYEALCDGQPAVVKPLYLVKTEFRVFSRPLPLTRDTPSSS
ncbi:hypothetical protein BDV38DRAFT_288540 [Aspergillus pseudotamarii]|uniref:Uncharacterized protein n=1 Tax=Aspergillus pseudotamarii TaxID=132259 RepID=A0A5N6SCA6_ASPPS|nr:uncharacterized protein BDV38DRAFT_288540 [Aspergillus pseudotamarii]KAE8131597.1 hypothetical protein BDV38DRAFT_288540 [Aspergillus pseudotamarii]